MPLESFSKNAADWIRLRLAFYGPDDAQALMLRCFRRSQSEHINERTVLAEWAVQDALIIAALDEEKRAN